MPKVVIEVPDDLLLTLREQPSQFAQTARLAVAIHYLREERLSLGQAARLAGLTRLQFLDHLAAHGIPAFGLSADEAKAEIIAARRVSSCKRP